VTPQRNARDLKKFPRLTRTGDVCAREPLSVGASPVRCFVAGLNPVAPLSLACTEESAAPTNASPSPGMPPELMTTALFPRSLFRCGRTQPRLARPAHCSGPDDFEVPACAAAGSPGNASPKPARIAKFASANTNLSGPLILRFAWEDRPQALRTSELIHPPSLSPRRHAPDLRQHKPFVNEGRR
jgi:hypothetical protein